MNTFQKEIYKYLLDGIHEGKFRKDERIPTEKELGIMFSTNRMNAHFAIKELERFGVLKRNKRQGTFVNHIPRTYSMGKMQRLTNSRICVLNLCVCQTSHIHWNSRIINALEEKLQEAGMEIDYRDASGVRALSEYRRLLKELVHNGCCGLIIIDNGQNKRISKHMEIFSEFHDNVYIFDRGFREWLSLPYNIVSINVFNEGLKVAEYLLSKKYTDVIICKTDQKPEPYWIKERIKGFRMGFAREQIEKEVSVCKLNAVGQAVEPELIQKIKMNPGKYTLVVQCDALAAATIDACVAEGLKPGKDFRTISFDNDADFRNYDLTTVSPSLERIGEYLATMVVKGMDNETEDVTCVKISSELMVRSSC